MINTAGLINNAGTINTDLTLGMFEMGMAILAIPVISFGIYKSIGYINKKTEVLERETAPILPHASIKKDRLQEITTGERALKILNDVIDDKFKYYFYKNILPSYLGSKGNSPIKNKEFQELKEKFITDILGSVTSTLIKDLGFIYSEKGIALHINQGFIYRFNKVDAKYFDEEEDFSMFGQHKEDENIPVMV
jgi:hypothetical protein